MILQTFLFLSFFVFSSYSIFASEQEPLESKFEVLYLDDSENPLNLDQVKTLQLNIFANNRDTLHSPQTLDFSVWYRIQAISEQYIPEAMSVTIDNPTLDQINFYLVEQDETKQIKLLGDTQRSSSELDYVVPQINLFDGLSKDQVLYIHIRTNGASATPVVIQTAAESQLKDSAQLMLLGCCIGIILIMMIYNFFMFRGVGDPSYLNYIGYIFFGGMTISLINGFTFFIFPFELASWMNNHLMISHFCGLAFSIRFAVSFLRFDSIKPWFVTLGLLLAKVNFALALSALVISEATLTPIYFTSVSMVYLYALVLMSQVIRSKFIWVRYYLISWLPLFVGVGVGIAAFNGGVEYNFITRNAALLGVLAEICIMAIALMDRFRANELDKDFRTHHDAITGLPNRTGLSTAIDKLVANKKTFSVALFEIPEARELIPSLGVRSANKLFKDLFRNIEKYSQGLNSVFEYTRNIQSKSHHIARVDTSSFAVIFLGAMPEDRFEYNILAIREAVSTIVNIKGADISVSSIAGVASYPSDTPEKDNILLLAHQALVEAKNEINGWSYYQSTKNTGTIELFKLAGQLQRAIANDDLQLYHQPKVEIHTGKVIGSELLLRWNHNELGYIPPNKIVEVAEKSGMIHQLTEWILNKGLSQHSKLLKLGFEHLVSINISGKDLTDNGFMAQILTAAVEKKVPAETVIFEINESAVISEYKLAKRLFPELHEQGFKIAIDDFNSGFSSINYLSKLPLYEIKIDRNFMNIDNSERSKIITEMSVALANKLGIKVVAKGVESEQVEEILSTFNCRHAQGHLYAEPMAFLDYMRWLQKKPKQVVSKL